MSKKKRLLDIDVNELSMVDSPAIGETFIITKNVKRGLEVTNKVTLNKATQTWNESVKKAVNTENEKCLFCGITKEQESQTLGLGLLCGVCFDCAFKRMEKGVFDQCIEGTFDFEKFKSEFPDDEIFKTDESESVDETENKSESVDETEKEDEESKKEDESESKEKEDEEKDDKKKDEVENNEDETEKVSDIDRLEKLENESKELHKSLDDVKDMLSTSLGIHEQTAMGFNEIVGLTFSALDLVLGMIESESDETSKSVKDIKDILSKENVSKAGAKISSSRLQTLRDIAEKLTQLIESVSGESIKESKEKSIQCIDELKNLTQKNTDLIKGMEEKFSGLTKEFETLSLAGGLSNSLDDDEENQVEKNDEVGFSDIIGIGEIKKKYETLKD